MSDKKTVAFLGLGAMGSRMAQRLLYNNYSVIVYNRSEAPIIALEEEGAHRSKSPAEAAWRADMVIGMVSDDEASRAIWLGEEGAMNGLQDHTVAISSSTLTPAWSEELARKMEEKEALFLEAPVVGTRPQAEQGELVYLVGGDTGVLDEARDVLDTLGSKILHLGKVGSAMRMKLAINAFLGIQAASLGEILTMIRHTMEDPEQKIEMLKALPVMSPLMARLLGKMVPGNYAPNFPIDLVEKDLRYFVSMLDEDKKERSFVEATRAIYAKASESGYGGSDITGIIQLFQ